MSESDCHRNLVRALAGEIVADPVWTSIPLVYCDIQDSCVAELPPVIGSNRPDVFAKEITSSLSIIGEAKTASDVDNRHTVEQLVSYFEYLRHQSHGELWMGVPWLSAGTAIRVSTHVRAKIDATRVPIRVVAFMIGDISIRRIWRE